MNSPLRTIRIADLGQILTGTTPPTADSEMFGLGWPFIKPSDLANGHYKVITTETELSDKGFASQSKRLLPALSTCVVCIGTIGKIGLTSRPSFTNQQINAIVVDRSKFDPIFVFYLLKANIGQVIGRNAGSASGRENVNKSAFASIEVEVPSSDNQRRIASILSAYDDLIENNTRRIAILEEMARRLFEEWFVRFRFPGHESVPLVESELGLVPDGWSLKKVNDIVLRLPSGVVYKQADVSPEGMVPVIDQSTSELLGFHDNAPAHKASADAPVVIFGDHTCKMQLMVTPFSLGPNTVPFVAKELAVHYVFWVVRGLIKTQEYKRHWSDLMKKSIIVAPVSIAQLFAKQVQSMAEFSELLKRKNRNLRTTRDLLLPKLISGELDVSTLPDPQAQTT